MRDYAHIGYGQTISAMNIHAMACEALYPALKQPAAHILDVGCGSGYLSAVFARLNPTATVFAADRVHELVDLTSRNLGKGDNDLLADGHVLLATADCIEGYAPGAPYDAIHVGAAAVNIPHKLLEQLKVENI
jgi:protein-L-isoaspartate(D-aspartate) O-methyltransferase